MLFFKCIYCSLILSVCVVESVCGCWGNAKAAATGRGGGSGRAAVLAVQVTLDGGGSGLGFTPANLLAP